MAVVLRKKPVTIYLQEIKYLMFQKMAKEQNRKAAAFAEAGVSELWTANPSDFEIFETFDLIDYKNS